MNRFSKKSIFCALLLAFPLSAQAADTLLASTPLELGGTHMTAELWGDRLKSGYADDLTILVKNDRQLYAAFAPSVKGGYNPLLQAVRVKPVGSPAQSDATGAEQDEQLLLSVGQGDWRAVSEFRVLDFADASAVREIFGAGESLGMVSSVRREGNTLKLKLRSGTQSSAELPEGAEGARLTSGGLYSLTAQDVDGDGQQELLSSQQILLGHENIADVGALWRLNAEGKWENSALTVMTIMPSPRSNTINDGKNFSYGTILPRRLVSAVGEATYPVFAAQNPELQNKVNDLLRRECEPYLAAYYAGRADMAFKVVTADERLLSLQIISGKTAFRHHYINIDPATGEKISLDAVLDTRAKDLPALLNLLCADGNIEFTRELPEEWYIEGKNIFFMEHGEQKDETAGFALANLHKYLRDPKWLEKKI